MSRQDFGEEFPDSVNKSRPGGSTQLKSAAPMLRHTTNATIGTLSSRIMGLTKSKTETNSSYQCLIDEQGEVLALFRSLKLLRNADQLEQSGVLISLMAYIWVVFLSLLSDKISPEQI